jgi:flagellar biogenesis protein FliO
MEVNTPAQVPGPPKAPWGAAFKDLCQRAWAGVKTRRVRRLRVCETLSLGERRFLAVIEFDRQEFLVGGSGNSLELLARLQEGRVIAEPSLTRVSHAR